MSAASAPMAQARSIIILGGKGGGTLAAHVVLRSADCRLSGYLNDRMAIGSPLHGGAVLGPFEHWPLHPQAQFVAPLHKAGHIQHNARRVAALGIPAARWATLIDPAAIVADAVGLGPGTVVAARAEIGPDATIGAHCYLRSGAIVSHDVTVGDFVYLGQRAVVAGYADIETGAHIAPGALIRDGVTVGRFSVVGMGAVVTADVPAFSIVMGTPARVTGRIAPLDGAFDSVDVVGV